MSEIFKIFLKLGLFGFGGPIATVAMMEQELQRKREWLSKERFQRAYTLCKIIPGPMAIQMAIYLGTLRAGILGGLLSGSLFILPGTLMVGLLTYIYFQGGAISTFDLMFYGMNPVVVAIVLESTFRLAKPNLLEIKFILLSFFSFFFMMKWSSHEIFLILGAGIFSILWDHFSSQYKKFFDLSPLLLLLALSLKAGALMFGGGFAIIALLEHQFVNVYHWMTHKEFLEGLTIGLITPGPVMASLVFYGYKISGFSGAILSPAVAFIPSFAFVFLMLPVFQKKEDAPYLKSFVEGAIPAIVGGIIAFLIPLGSSAIVDLFTAVTAVVSFCLLIRNLLPSWALILLAGGIGTLIRLF